MSELGNCSAPNKDSRVCDLEVMIREFSFFVA